MALTRKFLSALGIETDKIDEIIAAHTETVDGLKEERDSYKKSADKLTTVEKELNKLKTEAAENSGENSYENKYNALKKEFDTFKADITAKETKAKKTAAYKKLLKDAGISDKRIDTVLKVSDIDSLEFDENEKIKDENKHIESIKNDYADFIETETTKPIDTAKPPTNTGGESTEKSRASQIYKDFYANKHGKET